MRHLRGFRRGNIGGSGGWRGSAELQREDLSYELIFVGVAKFQLEAWVKSVKKWAVDNGCNTAQNWLKVEQSYLAHEISLP